MKYGEKIIKEFDVEKDLEIWPNQHKKNYVIKLTLPEFCCLCPRSGYPDFATIYIDYIPNEWVVELKAIKLYINSFMNRNISHENSANEIYDLLDTKLKPKWLKVVADFNPRGNVHTVIEIDSKVVRNESTC
ncbi:MULTISPECIES: preQ(1) synthase [Sulfurospirillum]|jgi:7-cyano-7-deazaguanine reductase|uniref:NADPH-dependent 7-cyano-7-deazaguanine reductase n=1 Tax=Sulfurospirillum cavolei TaxID=366522 RepID=A0A2D3WKP9_9BACT|nr:MULTISPECIES: preQ(1) synthase [Sulfurospirillum]KHG34602.1 MAG: 7-cyano-7-deazaguanine reductase [Sulfurospirillum sp. MES]MCD8544911.1 preQ(1) synthase [Sulfurospirillum cavolei]MCP3652493.1 preQ(1) synthase [Sulfurospirillum sp. DNRA8]MCR1811344.1 preQ(1) synthase [Sulfurospirillum sp. DNRA8]DAB37113.1 MAG TPA: NADPH-dependent 7-cyano-7-deazaguanine reductase QueF [Sulfurospirillum cavolei]